MTDGHRKPQQVLRRLVAAIRDAPGGPGLLRKGAKPLAVVGTQTPTSRPAPGLPGRILPPRHGCRHGRVPPLFSSHELRHASFIARLCYVVSTERSCPAKPAEGGRRCGGCPTPTAYPAERIPGMPGPRRRTPRASSLTPRLERDGETTDRDGPVGRSTVVEFGVDVPPSSCSKPVSRLTPPSDIIADIRWGGGCDGVRRRPRAR